MKIIMTSSCTNHSKRLKRGCLVSSNKVPTFRLRHSKAGFTMAEAMVAVSLAAVAFTSTLAALTRMNNFASVSRNYTGAYTAALTQIDAILTDGPFNPQRNQIPSELTPGTTSQPVTIYQEQQAGIIGGILQLITNPPRPNQTFSGTMTTTVVDVSPTPGAAPYIYRATVTITYPYLDHDGVHKPLYSFSMSTLRTSDT